MKNYWLPTYIIQQRIFITNQQKNHLKANTLLHIITSLKSETISTPTVLYLNYGKCCYLEFGLANRNGGIVMDTIVAILQLLAFIAPFAIGYGLNNDFEKKYGVAAIRWDYFIWQCIFLSLSILAIFGNNFSWWQILWIICTILTYAKALAEAKTHATKIGASSSDVTNAMVSQALYPLGAAILLITFLAFALGGKKKNRRKTFCNHCRKER